MFADYYSDRDRPRRAALRSVQPAFAVLCVARLGGLRRSPDRPDECRIVSPNRVYEGAFPLPVDATAEAGAVRHDLRRSPIAARPLSHVTAQNVVVRASVGHRSSRRPTSQGDVGSPAGFAEVEVARRQPARHPPPDRRPVHPLRVDPARPRSGRLRSHKNKSAGIDVNL